MTDDNAPARADVRPGDKVAGYLLEEQIGQGGMAVVYRAYDERLDRKVALKVLAPSLAADNAFRTRFIRESRAAATVEHPSIIPVYDAGDAGGCLFISMRYVPGGDVRALLADGKGLPPARAWNIISQVASALDMAHSHNLVHRDVKPANMLIDASVKEVQRDVNTSGPVTEHIYLSDFGISKKTVASNLTSTGQFVGTLDYIAPEQIEGQSIDGRADQYSLACAAFELLCGSPPFTGPNVFALINSHLSEQPPPATKLQPGLPPGVDRVLAKAMDKTPARRYATCAQFATDLGRALGLVPGPLDADGGQTVTPAGAGEQAMPQHQATELAGPAVAAGLGDQSRLAAQTAQEPAGTPPAASAHGPTPAGAGGPAVTDEQTMTAGMPGAASGHAPYAPQAQYGQYQPRQTYPQPGGPVGPGPGGGGTGWPQFMPQQQQPRRRSRGVLIASLVAAAAMIAAGVVVGIVVLSKPSANPPRPPHSSSPAGRSSPSTPPVATARSQATAVQNLLLTSEQSHTPLQGIVNDVGQCANLDNDISQLTQIVDQRSSEYNQATALQTGLIPNGATLKSQLVQALQISLRIDKDYLAWARQQKSSGCTVGNNSTYLADANNMNNTASADKQQFVDTWNPIAVQYGLQQFQHSQI